MTSANRSLAFDFSGLALSLGGLDPGTAERLDDDWSAFRGDEAAEPWLDVVVRRVPGQYDAPDFQPKAMVAESGPDGARFTLNEGHAVVDGSGRVAVSLIEGLDDRGYYALLNLVRASLAWRMLGRGGAVVHAAGLVVDDRAFLMVGAEGAGKSTWARLGEDGGARVLSDDLVLVDRARDAEGFEVLGSPFRSTHVADYRPGRFPLAAILFPVKGEGTSTRTVPALVTRARLTANLPFVAESTGNDPRVDALVDRMASVVPCVDFTFDLSGDYLDTLVSWPRP